MFISFYFVQSRFELNENWTLLGEAENCLNETPKHQLETDGTKFLAKKFRDFLVSGKKCGRCVFLVRGEPFSVSICL